MGAAVLPPARAGRGPPAAAERQARRTVPCSSTRTASRAIPTATRLESNDVAILLRSDTRAHIDDADAAVARHEAASRSRAIRRGFAGGGFDGGQSLPKQLAVAAGVPGADLIPDTSELFLGFTSTQRAGIGPGKIANFETLGYVDFRGSDYFRNGTHMHLSHIQEDLETWYLNFDFDERVTTAFRPNLDVPQDTQTVPQGPKEVSSAADVRRDYRSSSRIGHSASIQTTSRLQHAVVGRRRHACTRRARRSRCAPTSTRSTTRSPGPCARTRPARSRPPACTSSSSTRPATTSAATGSRWTECCPAARSRFPPRDRNQGFNSVLQTTHRQNFLVPPRRHRSFPLAEV